MKFSYLKRSLLALFIGLNSIFFSYSYNAGDLLKELVGSDTTITSDTQVLYKGILKSSDNYILVQSAIDKGYIQNKKLVIKLNSNFSNNSLKSRAKIYAGVSLSVTGEQGVSEINRQESIELIRTGYKIPKKILPRTTAQIQDELVKLLQRNRISDERKINELMQLLSNDPYAKLYSGEKAQDFEHLLNGELVGIGVSIQKDNLDNISIGNVYDGPAKTAGLQQGDIILRVDDTFFTKKDNLTQVVELIQGPVGTKVIISVLRAGKVVDFSIIRKKIIIDPIVIKAIDNNTTLFSISMFQTNTYKSFQEKLPTISKSKNLIIDLRNNLGGSLEDTTNMLNHFISKGHPLYHIESNGTTTTTLSKGGKINISSTTPIYFLTNHDTASASEIFAGVIHEYYPNSHIIGTNTYGKGTVQTVWTNDNNETIKFTTGRRLLGKTKTSIDGTGIKPETTLSDNPLTIQDEVLDYVLQQFKK